MKEVTRQHAALLRGELAREPSLQQRLGKPRVSGDRGEGGTSSQPALPTCSLRPKLERSSTQTPSGTHKGVCRRRDPLRPRDLPKVQDPRVGGTRHRLSGCPRRAACTWVGERLAGHLRVSARERELPCWWERAPARDTRALESAASLSRQTGESSRLCRRGQGGWEEGAPLIPAPPHLLPTEGGVLALNRKASLREERRRPGGQAG